MQTSWWNSLLKRFMKFEMKKIKEQKKKKKIKEKQGRQERTAT